jgi:hypothetical protein
LAVADHGVVRGDPVRTAYADSAAVMAALTAVGMDMIEVTAKLEAEGVDKFDVERLGEGDRFGPGVLHFEREGEARSPRVTR